jgi:hypothetical protein
MTRAASKRLVQACQGDLDGWRYSGAGLLVPAPRSRSYDRPVGSACSPAPEAWTWG